MKLLVLSAWYPLPADNGIRLRLSNLIRGLSRRHEIHLLTFAPTPPDAATADELNRICASVELVAEEPFANRPVSTLDWLIADRPRSLLANHSPTMARLVRSRAAMGYDVVIASQQHMLPYALALPQTPCIIDEIELVTIYDQYANHQHPARRARAYLTWWKLTQYLHRSLPKVAGATAVSIREQELLQSIAPAELPIKLVPNGVDLATYTNRYESPHADLLIYPGAISFAPNREAVAFFAREILPIIRAQRPNTRLVVTGAAEPAQIGDLAGVPGLIFAGRLPDVRPAVAGAWAEVVPLRSGSGTRLKVLEALALGTPVISTRKGAEGLDLVDERDLLLADSPADFAAATLRVLSSPALRHELSVQGRRAVARYDWSHSVAALETLIDQAVAAGGKRAAALR